MTTFLSCFSGIEAASVAWLPLGWKCVGAAERESAPCAVLAHHYPDVPNLGDVMAEDFLDRVAALGPDVLVGGPPCQDFSIAGLRTGIHGDRGNLTLRWVQIIHAARPDFCVTENVPGWLSANDGHAFGAFLAGLVGADTALVPPKKCGGRWTNAGMVAGPRGRAAWRILDARHFGLAQRRKRVFVVFCPRNGADSAQVLFEPPSLRGDTPPSREARERVAPTISARTQGGGGLGTDFDLDGGLMVAIAGTMRSNGDAHSGFKDEAGLVPVSIETLQPLVPVAYAIQERAVSENLENGPQGKGYQADIAYTLEARNKVQSVAAQAVRRLTPRECCRLMGFPDDYLDIPYRGKPMADGQKYKMLGNSFAVPVVRWIGERIAAQDIAA
jgi:DNA (cytosine-5)-methyltransferase 1